MSEIIHLRPILRAKGGSQARNPDDGLGRFKIEAAEESEATIIDIKGKWYSKGDYQIISRR
jgi:hypothetical protein